MVSFYDLMAGRPSLFLYSTNVFMKFLIQEQYRGGEHFAWCSEYFDPVKQGAYSAAYGIPVSSSPATLYRRYKEDQGDTHSSLINGQKASIKARAIEWFKKDEISQEELEDIIFMVDKNRESDWRPVIYVIHRQLVEAKLKPVPVKDRAGVGMEYVIRDLTFDEFDMIEV